MALVKCKNCGAQKHVSFLPTTATGFLLIPGAISAVWVWLVVTQQTLHPLLPLAQMAVALIASLAAFFVTASLLERFLSAIEWLRLKTMACPRCGQKDWVFSDMRHWGS